VSGTSNSNYDFLQFAAGTAYTDSGATTGESVAASDAEISVDGVTITSSTNVFSDAIQGVTFVAKATTASAFDLSIARDDSALVGKVEAFVTAYNTLTQANEKRYAKGGALASDSTLLSVMSSLRTLVGESGGSTGNSLSYLIEIGISVDEDGVMSLDSETLRTALTNEPDAVSNLLADSTNGIFARFDTVTSEFLDTDGLIDSREEGLRSSITSLDERIEQMERRLESVEARLRREFSALDALMARLGQTSAAISRTLG
jgi:flagellar hook-associated protein 2